MSQTQTAPIIWYRPLAPVAFGWWPSAIIMSIVFISFRPFSTSALNDSGGDIVNQLGFGFLGLFCLLLIVRQISANAMAAFLTPAWLSMSVMLLISVMNADDPMGAMRGMMFSVIVVLAAITALALPRNMDDLTSILATAGLTAVAACYLAVFLFPDQGMHAGGGHEAQHAGLWRGVYDHKNVAGSVMAAFVLIGWFVARNGRPLAGLVLAAAAFVFVLQAGSKTVLIILPAAILCAWVVRWADWAVAKVLILLVPILVLSVATLGAVLHPPILDILQSYSPGLTYTGRIDLWVFGIDHLAKSPWVGYGYESFWGTSRVAKIELPMELAWDVRGSGSGHNSWLDGAIGFGIPGTVLMALILVVLPVRDYLRIPTSGNAGKLAHLFLTIWILTLFGSNLESFFFRRADPVWFCMILAIIGLRLTAHMSINHTHAPMNR